MSKRRPAPKQKPGITRGDFLRLSAGAYVGQIKAMQLNGYDIETIASALGLTIPTIRNLLIVDAPKTRAMRQRNA
jgi:hypothetical protein